MRAATWATIRDIAAARQSWERARKIADALPADDPDRAAMRIAPRTMLCGTVFRVHGDIAGDRFEELRRVVQLRRGQGVTRHRNGRDGAEQVYHDRLHEASQLASEAMALIESVGDPTLTVGLSLQRSSPSFIAPSGPSAPLVTESDRPG